MDIDKADEFNFLKKVVEEDVQNKNSDGDSKRLEHLTKFLKDTKDVFEFIIALLSLNVNIEPLCLNTPGESTLESSTVKICSWNHSPVKSIWVFLPPQQSRITYFTPTHIASLIVLSEFLGFIRWVLILHLWYYWYSLVCGSIWLESWQ